MKNVILVSPLLEKIFSKCNTTTMPNLDIFDDKTLEIFS